MSFADAKLVAPLGPLAPPKGRPIGALGKHRGYRDWYNALIDFMLINPGMTNKELALYFNKSTQTIGQVVNNDMFRARLAARRQEHAERISTAIIEKTQGIAYTALSMLKDRLEDDRTLKRVPVRDLHEIASESLSRIGLGPASPGITIQQNITTQQLTVDPSALLRAQQRLRQNEAVLTIEQASSRSPGSEGGGDGTLPSRSPPALPESSMTRLPDEVDEELERLLYGEENDPPSLSAEGEDRGEGAPKGIPEGSG